jgi:hypothetical protein
LPVSYEKDYLVIIFFQSFLCLFFKNIFDNIYEILHMAFSLEQPLVSCSSLILTWSSANLFLFSQGKTLHDFTVD